MSKRLEPSTKPEVYIPQHPPQPHEVHRSASRGRHLGQGLGRSIQQVVRSLVHQ